MNPCDLARRIDNTLLKPYVGKNELETFCKASIRYGFNAVYVPPWFLPRATEILEIAGVTPATVAGFPQGTQPIDIKVREVKWAVSNGARAVDYVINIAAAKDKNYKYVFSEAESIMSVAGDATIKAIIEIGYFDYEELKELVDTLIDAGVHYIKTSTGFGPSGADPADVRLIREVVGDRIGIKAAGGIRTLSQLLKLLEAGADVIGTSSAYQIVHEAEALSPRSR